MAEESQKVGLIMTGGGARAAYQVGVLQAIAEITPKNAPSPFQVISGTSAGAINAVALAAHAHDYRIAVKRIMKIWSNFHTEHVFRSDVLGIMKTGAHWLLTMFSMGFLGRSDASYLLDRAPLEKLLHKYIKLENIGRSIDDGFLHALSVTASGYSSHQSVSFFEGHPSLEGWARARRIGMKAKITIDHLMASSAIPFIFAPQKINREYFGDGSMRQSAPISPALHLGAERVLVIGNRHVETELPKRVSGQEFPTLGQIAAHALNSIFLDSLEGDIERLLRINKTLSLIPEEKYEELDVPMRIVDVLEISPSQNIGKLAFQYVSELPWTMRTLLRGIGATKSSGSSLLSYLLFEKGYCRELIDLGYQDAHAKKNEIIELLGL
jgi:NTE family protein